MSEAAAEVALVRREGGGGLDRHKRLLKRHFKFSRRRPTYSVRTTNERETEVQNRSLAIELEGADDAGVQLLLQLPP